MVTLKRIAAVMDYPAAYRLWQAPFVRAKFAPILRRDDHLRARRVLDVGCGPGTNAAFFRDVDYVGLDCNASYLDAARRRFAGQFRRADVRSHQPPADERFDFILVNSLLHHIETTDVQRLLGQLHDLLTPDGHVHILDLVLPQERSVARLLALADRGDFPRPRKRWRSLFRAAFDEVLFESHRVGWFGVTFWHMVYFQGKAKR
jgi:SAM-dependent methyltransferase